MSSAPVAPYNLQKTAISFFIFPLRLFHLWLSLPTAIFLLALTAMLFRPPDLKSFPIDRVAFFALLLLLAVRASLRHGSLRAYPATWPLLGLMLLGLLGLNQPYDPQAWSVFAAKWVVPCVFFHIAGLVFSGDRSLRKLETFLLIVLAYLTAISIFSMLDLQTLIVPRFITDEGIGIHADRARGPFLQAVANGLCLNLLGLVALDSFRRRKLRGIVAAILFLAVPVALLATKTRAVWIASVLSVVCLAFFGSTPKLRRIGLAGCVLAIVGSGTMLLLCRADRDSFVQRAMDRSPVDFRTEMYSAGWQMFIEKPLLGWGNQTHIQAEVEKRVSSFHPEYYVFHNTFLELAVERGLIGLGLYVWLMICLFRLGKTSLISDQMDGAFSSPHFRRLWPLLLGVYLLNASAVVMNYQFVNAVLFTIAGILAALTSGKEQLFGQPRFVR